MTTRTKPRRRWFQFSLRTLLVLVAVVAVWLALLVNAARKQREAVAAIEALGGRIVYEHGSNLPPGPKWLRELIGEEYFFRIIAVGLSSTQITDSGLEHLEGLTSLQTLVLDDTQITDAGLEHVKGLTSLQTLVLKE